MQPVEFAAEPVGERNAPRPRLRLRRAEVARGRGCGGRGCAAPTSRHPSSAAPAVRPAACRSSTAARINRALHAAVVVVIGTARRSASISSGSRNRMSRLSRPDDWPVDVPARVLGGPSAADRVLVDRRGAARGRCRSSSRSARRGRSRRRTARRRRGGHARAAGRRAAGRSACAGSTGRCAGSTACGPSPPGARAARVPASSIVMRSAWAAIGGLGDDARGASPRPSCASVRRGCLACGRVRACA